MRTADRDLDCAAVLFDLDGVLIDSTRCVERHWREWALRHGLDSDAIMEGAHGVRNVDTMRRVAPDLDVETEAARFAEHEASDTEGVVAVDGAVDLLAALGKARWAVVTSCSTALARARLKTAGLSAPPLLITGDDVLRGKPDPDPYLLAAARLGIDPAECIVVEDAPAGIEAGKRAGMRVIGIAFTYAREQLESASADFLVDRLADMTVRLRDEQQILISL